MTRGGTDGKQHVEHVAESVLPRLSKPVNKETGQRNTESPSLSLPRLGHVEPPPKRVCCRAQFRVACKVKHEGRSQEVQQR